MGDKKCNGSTKKDSLMDCIDGEKCNKIAKRKF